MQGGLDEIKSEIMELKSRMSGFLWTILKAMASESRDGPRLFTFEPMDGDWNQFIKKKYRLRLWCEAEGCEHPMLEVGKGVYEVKIPGELIQRIAPYFNFIVKVLKTILPMVSPAINSFFGSDTIKKLGIENQLNLAKEATGKLLPKLSAHDPGFEKKGAISVIERSGILALHALIKEIDPLHKKIGLHRFPTYTGGYLWLCDEHYDQYRAKIPEKFEYDE